MTDSHAAVFDYDRYTRAPMPSLTEDRMADGALKANIAEQGQRQPIIADADGHIWVGWRRFLACQALKISPWIVVVEDGAAAVVSDLMRREHSAIDRARILKWLGTTLDRVANFAAQKGRLNERLARHLRNNLGLTKNISERHITSALRLADITDAEAAQIRAMKADGTVHSAEQALRRIRSRTTTSSFSQGPGAAGLGERIVKDADQLLARIRALPSLDTCPLVRERLQSFCDELLARLGQNDIAAGEQARSSEHAAFIPWKHQKIMCSEAIAAVVQGLLTIALVGPTGSGKTALGFMVAAGMLDQSEQLFGKPRKEARIIWMSLTREQEAQARKFHAEFGLVPINNIIFLSAFHRSASPCDVLIIDEDHRTAMPTLVRQYERFKPTIAIGLTATHFRLDRNALAFQRVIKAPSINALISDGVLSPFEHYVIPEFSSATVADLYCAEPERWTPALAFFDTIAGADDFVARIQRAGHSAETVTATSPRAAQIAAFQQGSIAVLAAVGVLAEGFDAASLTTVFVRDGSRGPTMQLCGRVLRRYPGKTAKIVQSRHTRHPYTREATPCARFLWSPEGWVPLQNSQALTALPLLMADRKAATPITLPSFLDRRQRRRRSSSPSTTQEES